jgi:GNAT superfamily N-acetyltransferase
VPPSIDHDDAVWLEPDDENEVAALLEVVLPGSYAWPGRPGVARWAGLRDDDGNLVATAADAWSAPEVGFVAGVATDVGARGNGDAMSACAVVVNELVRKHGQAALMVDDWNEPAIAVYERLGMRRRRIAAARFV